jgi:hypothetical protein
MSTATIRFDINVTMATPRPGYSSIDISVGNKHHGKDHPLFLISRTASFSLVDLSGMRSLISGLHLALHKEGSSHLVQ